MCNDMCWEGIHVKIQTIIAVIEDTEDHHKYANIISDHYFIIYLFKKE